MKLKEARAIAERIRAELLPFCERCEIAGSIRRRKPEVGDIEIVAIPKMITTGLFGEMEETHPEFVALVNRWPAVKGKASGKYTQRTLPEGIALDLFMATRQNWGVICAIRTGSAEYSHLVLAMGWTKAGYHSVGGLLMRNGVAAAIEEEQDLFELLGLPWKEPWKREIP